LENPGDSPVKKTKRALSINCGSNDALLFLEFDETSIFVSNHDAGFELLWVVGVPSATNHDEQQNTTNNKTRSI
jgi:hypothetical protein